MIVSINKFSHIVIYFDSKHGFVEALVKESF